MKCVACGSTALVEGNLIDISSGFKPKETSNLKSLLGIGVREITAYGCVHCHHLQLGVGFTEKDLLRYQQFEGEQPPVLERINSEPKELKN